MGSFGPAASSSGAALTRLDEEPGVCTFWSWNNVIIGAWREQATEPSVRRLSEVMDRVLARYPSGVSGLHVLREGLAPPTAGARRLFGSSMERYGDNVAALGIVLMGGGFWASAVHAAITGIRMLSRRSVEMRIDGALGPAARWLCPLHTKRTATPIAPDELCRVAEAAFSQVIRESVLDPPASRLPKI